MFELKEYSETQLPDSLELIQKAQEFISVDNGWNHSKILNRAHIFNKWHGNDYWCMRVSNHIHITYEDMLATIFHNHTENEKDYMDSIESYKSMDPSKDGSWQSKVVTYKLPFPFAKRDMVFWMVHEESFLDNQFLIITLPRDTTVENCKGMYVAIEEVTRLEDGGIQWSMATTSEAGGLIPRFIQRMALPGAIANDIPQFEKWINKKKKENNGNL
ncbi:hypothetical protein DASB73_015170 [Starmerella bacillaris]|uniref:DUF3074 domain-containing protein n=1 Tax=Starmerella bacillaris TaxID=1247836 RepID=A0AAV5RG50_STABA|nr:hypothetical protein DASB73_015170 [Starmerella bacillaris]